MKRTILIGVVSSLIATIVYLYLIDPIIRTFGELVVLTSHYVATGLVDNLYRKCALSCPPDSAFALLGLFSGLLAGMTFGALSVVLRSYVKSGPAPDDEVTTMKKLRRSALMGLGFLVLLGFLLMFLYWTTWFQLQRLTSFNQHLAILAPFIDNQREEELRSKWALMKGRKDYEAIVVDILSIAEENGVGIPDNPSYSVTSF